jgi:small subunit ribosomal protein S1
VVKDVDARGATIEVEGGIEGYVKANDIAKERVEDASQYLKVGDAIEAKYLGMDRKGRAMQLSIKAKDEAELAETLAEVNKASDASMGTTRLGALLREQLNKGE